MPEFMKSNARLDEIIVQATQGPHAGYEHMRAAMRAQLQADGVIARDRENELGMRLLPGQYREPPAATLPANPAAETCFRIIYPGGNARFEIYGASELALDEQEAKLRAMYGGQR